MTSTSIVLELQRMATGSSVDVGELLRKALVVATKLGLTEFRDWIRHELNGYGDSPVPAYRACHAEVSCLNPYRGMIPVVFQSKEASDLFCEVKLADPIRNLTALLETDPQSGSLMLPLSPQQTKYLIEIPNGLGMPPLRTISRNQISGIIDIVRSTLLEWALRLEQQGIMGKGMSFSEGEKQKASTSTQVQIGNFQGILGNIQGSTVQQDLKMAVTKNDFASLKGHLATLGLIHEDIEELRRAVEADPKPQEPGKFGANVSAWLGKMTEKAASGVWSVGVRAAGGFLAEALSAYYGFS